MAAEGTVRLDIAAVWSAAGAGPAELGKRVGRDAPAPRPDPCAGPGRGAGSPPVLSAPELDGLGYEARVERMVRSMAPTLEACAEQAGVDGVVALPPAPHAPGRAQGAGDRWRDRLARALPALGQASWYLPGSAEAPVALLAGARDAVAEGRHRAVLVLGVDACAAVSAWADPALMAVTGTHPAVRAPADAAGGVLLRPVADAAPGPGPGLCVERCASAEAGDAESWQSVLRTVAEDAGGDWDETVRYLGAGAEEARCWADVRRGCDRLRRAPEPDGVLAWRTVGHPGGAALPLLLALCAGRLVQAPQSERLLLVAGGARQPGAGAVLLRRHRGSSPHARREAPRTGGAP